MPVSGIAFVARGLEPHDAAPGTQAVPTTGEKKMCIERLARNAGFALVAIAIVAALGFTIEYQPVLNALAR
jgi:hypothetical protein